MKIWGYLPFQNEKALEKYGHYILTGTLKTYYTSELNRGTNCEYPFGFYMVIGAILSSFGIYNKYMIDQEDFEIISKAIKTRNISEEISQLITQEMWVILNTSTLDIEDRKHLLKVATRMCYDYLQENNITSTDTLDTSQPHNCLLNLHNTAAYIIAGNFSNIKPITFKSIDINWLYKQYRENKTIDFYSKKIRIVSSEDISRRGKKTKLYTVQDKNRFLKVTSDELKTAIRNKEITCINAKLTSNNRLLVNYD